MSIEFHKMHGAGNDFVLIDAREQSFETDPGQAARIANRRFGIGCDQILVLRPAKDEKHLLKYEIWNADGTLAGQCGNGARCVAYFIELAGQYPGHRYTVESPSGIVTMQRCDDGEYELEMAVPAFAPEDVPIHSVPENHRYFLESPWGPLEFGAVSMGNPHCLVIVDDISDERIPAMGAWLQSREIFVDGVNAGFAQLVDRSSIQLRVVERGAGETLACGTGACASVVILRQWDLLDDCVDVSLPGGHLVIKWLKTGQAPLMRGPAEYIYRGIMDE